MFVQKGESIPMIRFKGFNDNWGEKKLGDVFLERSTRSAEGELISVTINSGVVKSDTLDRKDNSSSDKSNYKQVKIGDLAYNSMRMWQGASGYSPYEGILSPAYTVLIPKAEINSKFFAYMFKKTTLLQEFQRFSQGLTSDTWNLKYPALKNIKVSVPSFEEQNKIAEILSKLDNNIFLYQDKLNKLDELKKSLLQQMFI